MSGNMMPIMFLLMNKDLKLMEGLAIIIFMYISRYSFNDIVAMFSRQKSVTIRASGPFDNITRNMIRDITWFSARHLDKSNIKKFLYCIWHDKEKDYLIISMGFLSELIKILHMDRQDFEVLDFTQKVPEIDFDFYGKLYGYQEAALEDLKNKQFGVLVGPVGSGKKVLALKLSAIRKVPVLTIVRTKRQLYQWKEVVSRFLSFKGDDIG